MSDDDPRIARLIRNQDNLEGQFARLQREQLRAMQGDIAAVKRAIEKLVAARAAQDSQPDWISCREPDTAELLLTDLDDWTTEIGRPLGLDVLGCWPWHPAAVALLLAAKVHHATVMAGDNPVAVTDYLVRHLPGLEHRVRQAAKHCNDQQHKIGEAAFAYDTTWLAQFAYWWASDRTGLAPGLTPWEERADTFGEPSFHGLRY